MGDDRIEWVGQQIAERVDHPEQDARAHGDDRRHDLVGGEARYEQTDGGERCCEEQEAEEAAVDRSPVGLAVDTENDRITAREPERQQRDRQTGDELGEDDLDLRDGGRQEKLERTRPSLLREEPHRNHGHDEEEQHRRLEEDADELARPVEEEDRGERVAHQEQVDRYRGIGDGRRENRPFLLEEERAQMPHARDSGPSFVRPRKSASRSTGAGPISRSPKPPATTAVASASAMGPIAASTK